MKIKILAGTIAVVCGVVAIGVYNTKNKKIMELH